MTRRILLIANVARPGMVRHTLDIIGLIVRQGLEVAMLPADLAATRAQGLTGVVQADPRAPANGSELVCILGGDGTILRAADMSRGSGTPLLGINFGHVGFLAQAEQEDLREAVGRIVDRDYSVEERLTLDVAAMAGTRLVARSWALNEVTVEKASRERMLELIVEIDGRPVSTLGADGMIIATPTGSTAYAFSSGGPIIWPDVAALLVVPISAHALFARPMVVGPYSKVAIELVPDTEGVGIMWCDGARLFELPEGARVEVSRGRTPVMLARLNSAPFADRLVEKFALPVVGWRGRGRQPGAYRWRSDLPPPV